MREINRAMADHIDATEMLRKMLDSKSVGSKGPVGYVKNETRLERRARERSETKAAKRKQKATI